MGVKVKYVNVQSNNHQFRGEQLRQPHNYSHMSEISQQSQQRVQRNFNWAYEVTTNDANYNDRRDKNLDWFLYDWDQNEQIEAFYQEVLLGAS